MRYTATRYTKVTPGARAPSYGSAGAACFDLCANLGPLIFPLGLCVPPGSQVIIGTGIAVELDPGTCMLVFSRSGHGFNKGIRLANCVGVIDSDYRGEIRVCLRNDGNQTMTVNDGDRIAQGLIQAVPKVQFEEVSDLSKTARGANGFGSTGA